MKTVFQIIEELRKYPPDALAYAYEGEMVGIVVVAAERTTDEGGGSGHEELGYVLTSES